MIKRPVRLDVDLNIIDTEGKVLVPCCWNEASDHKRRQKEIGDEIVLCINGGSKNVVSVDPSPIVGEVEVPIKRRGRPPKVK